MSFSMPDFPHLVPVSSTPIVSSPNPPLSSTASVPTCIVDLNHPAVMWHPQTGLVVSPNTTYVPQVTHKDPSGRRDFSKPSVLDDSEIYLAFRPRFARNEGDLFGRLNINREALCKLIVPFSGGRYILDANTIELWSRLENALLDVGDTLLKSKTGLPTLSYPRFPWEYGYRDSHESRDVTIRCAIRAQQAFLTLTSVVTFALSLYMDESGALDNAYATLMKRSSYKVYPAWLDLLSASFVCNFHPSFRVGGYIDPYTSNWSQYIPNFVNAKVPIWILWESNYSTGRVANGFALKFLPSVAEIEDARARSVASTTFILPAFRYDPFDADPTAYNSFQKNSFSTPDNSMGSSETLWDSVPPPFMDEPSPLSPLMPTPASPSSMFSSALPQNLPQSQPSEGGEQRALVQLEEFFAKLQRGREASLAVETAEERLSRIDREKYAEMGKWARRSTVYVWELQEDGTYVRNLVNSRQVPIEWSNVTPNQRRYTGHLNVWDLCPQLPRYSEEHPKLDHPYDSEDSDYDSIHDDEPSTPPVTARTVIDIPNDKHRQDMATILTNEMIQVNELSDDRQNASQVETPTFETCLRDRFGYDTSSPQNWNGVIIADPKVARISSNAALMALSTRTAPSGLNSVEAVVRLVRLLSGNTWTFLDLPAAFDHSLANPGRLSLQSDTLTVRIVTTDISALYLIQNKGYIDEVSWAIATSHASTVLLIFRNSWRTVDIIARELVRRGVPFKTVAALTKSPAPVPFSPSRGLGPRPEGYTPAHMDYTEYVRRRNDLLKGSKGRAALLHGGIVARIARDVLETNIILNGPSTDASAVANFGRFTLVDDQLTDNDIDIICGVYYVKNKNAPQGESFISGTRSHVSWWPKDNVWSAQNCFLQTEWTELAEEFYQKQLQRIQTNFNDALLNASNWRSALRRQNTVTKMVEAGAEHYQAGYLEHLLRLSHSVGDCR